MISKEPILSFNRLLIPVKLHVDPLPITSMPHDQSDRNCSCQMRDKNITSTSANYYFFTCKYFLLFTSTSIEISWNFWYLILSLAHCNCSSAAGLGIPKRLTMMIPTLMSSSYVQTDMGLYFNNSTVLSYGTASIL